MAPEDGMSEVAQGGVSASTTHLSCELKQRKRLRILVQEDVG